MSSPQEVADSRYKHDARKLFRMGKELVKNPKVLNVLFEGIEKLKGSSLGVQSVASTTDEAD